MYTSTATYENKPDTINFGVNTDHLGNVRAVVSDVREPVDITGSIDTWTWQADVTDHFSYYPFGMLEPGRQKRLNTVDDGGYRFGFGSQEREDKISSIAGTHYSAEFWMYDSRLGRRWEIDPVNKPWISSYAVLGDNPIFYIDPYGDDWFENSEDGSIINIKGEDAVVDEESFGSGWIRLGEDDMFGDLEDITGDAEVYYYSPELAKEFMSDQGYKLVNKQEFSFESRYHNVVTKNTGALIIVEGEDITVSEKVGYVPQNFIISKTRSTKEEVKPSDAGYKSFRRVVSLYKEPTSWDIVSIFIVKNFNKIMKISIVDNIKQFNYDNWEDVPFNEELEPWRK